MPIKEEDVPIVSTVAATLLSGLIGSMKDVPVSVNDALYVAELIVNGAYARTVPIPQVVFNGKRRFIPQSGQPSPHS